MVKKIYKINGMHCTSCGFLVDEELEAIGVKSKASYQKSEVEVDYDETKVTEAEIVAAVKKAGYQIIPG
jgi:copper chaperone